MPRFDKDNKQLLEADMQTPVVLHTIHKATLSQALKMLLPFVGIFGAFTIFTLVPSIYPATYTPRYWSPVLLICASVYAVFYITGLFVVPLRKHLLRFAWFIMALFLVLELQDLLTLKSGFFRMPFVPSPDKIIEQFIFNIDSIITAALSSMRLLFIGLAIGLVLGFFSGVVSGCSRIADYWVSPLVKIVGPVPGIIWLPIFLIAFSSQVASIAAIVISVWFPMTLMLSSAIANTDELLIERAETLGASKRFIIRHVLIPNAGPALADALFMGLSGSFGALSAAELVGAKTGLAVYVRMSGSMGNFGLLFSYVGVEIFIFATLTAIMFAVRHWLLRWQKGLVRMA